MKVFYYENKEYIKTDKSIFLAGPTPRDNETKSWRNEALDILNSLGWDGNVYVPESNTGKFGDSFTTDKKEIVDWELEHLENATVIVFWVPRELSKMPAFTTNVEFGYHIKGCGYKCVYGRPDNSPKNFYLDYLYQRELNREPSVSLKETLMEAIALANKIVLNQLKN